MYKIKVKVLLPVLVMTVFPEQVAFSSLGVLPKVKILLSKEV